MDRGKLAKELFNQGYNCAQAIVLAFQDKLNIEKKQLEALSSSFGGGVARLREICGCISGMGIVLGLMYGNYDKLDNDAKSNHYQRVQKLSFLFKDKMKSYICSDLLNQLKGPEVPVASIRNETYYNQRPCGKYIEYMANLIESEINSNE